MNSIYRFFLALMFLLCLDISFAFSLDFVTRAEFEAEKNDYKDLPLKILFKKLNESSGAEKVKIRNAIILKQTFDPNFQAKIQSGAIQYQKSFGVIKALDQNKLSIWVPETDEQHDFYVGISRIPVENRHAYRITEANIERYAAIVYSLDKRIYKVEISFLPERPGGLKATRKGQANLIEWKPPAAAEKPTAYQVFVNGKLYATVDKPEASIPRDEGRADKYYVKAVYQHGAGLIGSEASVEIQDEITLAEIKRKGRSAETYALMLAALNRSEWETAKEILYQSQTLFEADLTDNKKAATVSLTAFFHDIDNGVEISARKPVSVESLDQAVAVFKQAEQKAKAMPTGIDVTALARSKIEETVGKRDALAQNIQQVRASETFAAVLLALKPAEWEKAKKMLYDNQALFNEYLSDQKKGDADSLVAFFKDIDEGSALSSGEPLTADKLDQAASAFQQAEQKAMAMAPAIDVRFLSRLKIDDIENKRAVLEKRNQQLLAADTYASMLAALNPNEWEKAKSLLNDNRELFDNYLDTARKRGADDLGAFFRDIDEGRKLADKQPETIGSLEQAMSVYRRAEEKAQALPPDMDVRFLAELKIEEIDSRRAALEKRESERLAAESAAAASAAALAKKKQARVEKALPAAEKIDRGMLVKEAEQSFDTGDYQSAYDYYSRAYSKQIEKLNQGGKKQLSGLLGLPSKYRAQIIFLNELERLKKKHNNNQALIRRDLEELTLQIENREGMWVIIPETRRAKILERIAEY